MAEVTKRHLEMARSVAFQRGVLDFGSIEARRLFAQALADIEAEAFASKPTLLKSAESAREGAWVPCADGLPREDGAPVWFFAYGKWVCEGTFDVGGYWNDEGGCYPQSRVTHWRPRYVEPVPAPPDAGKETT